MSDPLSWNSVMPALVTLFRVPKQTLLRRASPDNCLPPSPAAMA